MSEKIVVIPYTDLIAGKDFATEMERAYGGHGLGILLVSGVPNLPELRQDLLKLGQRFFKLPDAVKAKYESPETSYSFGWSLGKEKMKDGKPDYFKGSYYNNPTVDVPTTDPELLAKFPESCHANIWPTEDLPELEPAFKAVGKLVADIGALVAEQCDAFAHSKISTYPLHKAATALRQSLCHKSRLLYYLPINQPLSTEEQDSWCGWHYDHSILTGLVPAMFQNDGEEAEIPSPDQEAGLYIEDWEGNIVQMKVPKDCLAFQLGQTFQVYTGGRLKATNHCVRSLRWPSSKNISRTTFATFLEPTWDTPVEIPEGSDPSVVGVRQWKSGMDFGAFSAATLSLYY
eukprot:TRINITY_DN15821_c0_g1_i1.p1 TRINITY_DN15821_c0_g1~~TRINITY_DN15821_c0_g1_i1.p1  ORF type:complete len:345 (+),score=69.79 TRINITY_DN15821_c0_g1_i1:57-1091(+)